MPGLSRLFVPRRVTARQEADARGADGVLDPDEVAYIREAMPTMSIGRKFNAARKLRAHELAVWRTSHTAARQPWQAERRPSPRGYLAPYGGYMKKPMPLPEIRGTTCRVCGLWPFPLSTEFASPGWPIGIQDETATPFFFDQMAWFDAEMISAPIAVVLGPNGFGKSTLGRQLVLGGLASGRHVICPADIKPDYRRLCELLNDNEEGRQDGQVIEVGPGHGVLNPLDPTAYAWAIDRLPAGHPAVRGLMAELHQTQLFNLEALVSLRRRAPLEDFESAAISAALTDLYAGDRFSPARPPIISDLIEQLEQPTEDMRYAVAATSAEDFAVTTHRLLQSLKSLTVGMFGEAFNGQTTTRLNLEAAMIDIDLSIINVHSGRDLRAAIIAITGMESQAAVAARMTLADHGFIRKSVTDIHMDELSQLLDVGGSSQIKSLDRITRTNRTDGMTLTTYTHTVTDFTKVSADATEQGKATGFISRSKVTFTGPINGYEIDAQAGLIDYTDRERARLLSWTSAPPPAQTGHKTMPHPGKGRFIAKWGDDPDRPGLAFRTWISPVERELGIHDTNTGMRTD
ncbi:hypothetical protein IU443_28340 [Nocardia farcinica]|uniref:hypothetical protein n=1 Tax=Nocardia farcinica TaxID=37329 RepID=UPI001894E340|nr:hypothetical protein [Nocardia farcinica]MBF6393841.1 hypothetical protein [Nocardia farcinica]MBF6411302.1 hypothetical protein [Nocardia farcinica]MCZ9330278.1 hypothetical protein [Nocardia farcinica]UEX26199.1 hypothetical protein LMJ57_30070 [Nocardia farcinica]